MNENIAIRPVSYGITKEQIESVRLECENLSAATSGGYIQVKNALVKVTTLLNVLDAERKDLQSVAKTYVDRVNSEARSLRIPLEDIQATLKAKKKAVDDAKAQAKRAKEDAARAAEMEKLRIEREANEKIKLEAEAATRAAEEATRKLEAAQRVTDAAMFASDVRAVEAIEAKPFQRLDNLNDALSSVPSNAHASGACPTCGRPF